MKVKIVSYCEYNDVFTVQAHGERFAVQAGDIPLELGETSPHGAVGRHVVVSCPDGVAA